MIFRRQVWGSVIALAAAAVVLVSVPGSSAFAGSSSQSDSCVLTEPACDSLLRQTLPMPKSDIQVRYDELGGAFGLLGYPIGGETTMPDGSYQRFQNSVIVSSPVAGTRVVDTETFEWWLAGNRELGWPTASSWSDHRGVHTAFQNGEVIQQSGGMHSAESVDMHTAVLICDSQCDGDSWSEQGARAAGFSTIIERSYGGAGFAATSPVLDSSVTEGLLQQRVLLPEGTPGLVLITLGGNDATQGVSDDEILASMRSLLSAIQTVYPETTVVVNGVMSQASADHGRRRAVDALIMDEASRQHLRHISVAGWGTRFEAEYRDGVHLTPRGHDAISTPYAAALRQVLSEGS